MCYNVIQCHEYQCPHYSIVRKQKVDCNRKTCRFSAMHEMGTHDCSSMCVQAMLLDQSIITDKRSVKCSRCAGTMNGH